MAGDTKLSARWHPDLRQTNQEQWARPVKRVLTYSDSVQCRYGFLITDNELVIFQFAREYVGLGIGATRSPRQPQHRRGPSTVSELSDSVRAMSISSRTQSYVESGKGLEYQSPKYRVIPWANQGESDLTVKSALFHLCVMAGYGSGHISTSYPKLSTWWYLSDGRVRHNTSGFIKMKPGAKDNSRSRKPRCNFPWTQGMARRWKLPTQEI
ncbi:hypothetical protein C8A03DRAFT_39039, partial [Achaetomium macrosporum]